MKVAGQWVYLYRAIDQFGQVIDVLVSEERIWWPPPARGHYELGVDAHPKRQLSAAFTELALAI